MLGQEKKVCMLGDLLELGGLDTVCSYLTISQHFLLRTGELLRQYLHPCAPVPGCYNAEIIRLRVEQCRSLPRFLVCLFLWFSVALWNKPGSRPPICLT